MVASVSSARAARQPPNAVIASRMPSIRIRRSNSMRGCGAAARCRQQTEKGIGGREADRVGEDRVGHAAAALQRGRGFCEARAERDRQAGSAHGPDRGERRAARGDGSVPFAAALERRKIGRMVACSP